MPMRRAISPTERPATPCSPMISTAMSRTSSIVSRRRRWRRSRLTASVLTTAACPNAIRMSRDHSAATPMIDGRFSAVLGPSEPEVVPEMVRRSWSGSRVGRGGAGPSVVGEALLDGVAGQFDAVVQLQLLQGVLDVVLDGAVADAQPLGRLLRREPL